MGQAHRSTQHRLTIEDVTLFERTAESMIRHAEWFRVIRTRDEEAEYFEIQTSSEERVAFSVGRCVTGNYVFLDHRTGDVRFAGTLLALLETVQNLRG